MSANIVIQNEMKLIMAAWISKTKIQKDVD